MNGKLDGQKDVSSKKLCISVIIHMFIGSLYTLQPCKKWDVSIPLNDNLDANFLEETAGFLLIYYLRTFELFNNLFGTTGAFLMVPGYNILWALIYLFIGCISPASLSRMLMDRACAFLWTESI
ncbi:1228_t:CDS:2 [Funneliformis mosseae]|uniref:1228_t:CDS:1 n=1 Tax=Funneliformis mosseae TaxID=27381 RepID=A0A9N9AWJ8_FUNMO|nr:1228_t:CDS:2 [Funneliformis mosseae]